MFSLYDTLADGTIALEDGQLIKDEDFTLFEAVGALEVGQYHNFLKITPDALSDHGSQNGQRVCSP